MANGICGCSNPTIIDPGTNPCGDPKCLNVPHLLVKEEDSILPCGQTLVVDIHDKVSLSNSTDKSVAIVEIIDHTDNLTNVTTLSNTDNSVMQISMMSNYQGYPKEDYKFAKITYKIYQGFLSKMATLTIIFKNSCTNVSVPAGKYCDPCSGNLLDKTTNIQIGDDTSSTSTTGATTNIQIG